MSYPLILSAPAFAPPIPVDVFEHLTYEWVTPDGDVIELSDWETGLVVDNRGVEGLHFPLITKHSTTASAVPGKRQRGWRAEARAVVWPLQIWGDTSEEWLARYEALFSSIHPEREGTWRVSTRGQSRELPLTGVFTDSHVYELDPVMEAWAPYAVRLEAARPYWRGSVVRTPKFRAPEGRPFIDGDGGPPVWISPSANLATASIENKGDVESFPVWTIEGPLSAVSVGVGGRVINVPFDVAEGAVLRIDTDTRNVTALLDGVDVTTDLGFQPFAAVPSGGRAALHIEAAGTGSVQAELVPLFFRAF